MNEKKTIIDYSILAAEISWIPRYSFTEKSDEKGRWARIAMYRSIKIALINRIEDQAGSLFYHLSMFFPVKSTDHPFYKSNFKSFKEATECAEYQWIKFLNHCCLPTRDHLPENKYGVPKMRNPPLPPMKKPKQ